MARFTALTIVCALVASVFVSAAPAHTEHRVLAQQGHDGKVLHPVTKVEDLRNEALLRKVADELDLEDDDEFTKRNHGAVPVVPSDRLVHIPVHQIDSNHIDNRLSLVPVRNYLTVNDLREWLDDADLDDELTKRDELVAAVPVRTRRLGCKSTTSITECALQRKKLRDLLDDMDLDDAFTKRSIA